MLAFIWKIRWMCMNYILGLDTPTVSTSSHSKKKKNVALTFVSFTLHHFENKVTWKEYFVEALIPRHFQYSPPRPS